MLNAAKQIRGVGRIYEKAMDLKKTQNGNRTEKKKNRTIWIENK